MFISSIKLSTLGASNLSHQYNLSLKLACELNSILNAERSQFGLKPLGPNDQEPLPSPPISIGSHHNRISCNVECNLIVEITSLLFDCSRSADYRYLQKWLLRPLHQTLFLTGLAIRAYEDTPLGQNLILRVDPVIQQCHLILQGMLDTIYSYRNSHCVSHNRSLWPAVLWSELEVQEQARMLLAPTNSLRQILVELNS